MTIGAIRYAFNRAYKEWDECETRWLNIRLKQSGEMVGFRLGVYSYKIDEDANAIIIVKENGFDVINVDDIQLIRYTNFSGI